MSKLEILTFPNPRLRIKCKPVDEITPEIQKLVEDMLETMYDASGIGLAAAQVDRQVRVLVIDTRAKADREVNSDIRYESSEMTDLEKQVPQPLVLINPEITKKEGKTTFEEGCLSVPSYFETVDRYDYVEVKALDKDGKEIEIKTDGLLSICIQHEIDHLDGKLFIDRLSTIKGNRIKNKIKKFGYPEDEEETEEETLEEQV